VRSGPKEGLAEPIERVDQKCTMTENELLDKNENCALSHRENLSSGINPDLSIIVVSFNTREMTLACLQSVIAETRSVNYEIIVVDNNSSDGTASAIRKQFSRVELIALSENLGFAQANNLAARQARGRRILLLNPDTVVLDGAIDRLYAFADRTPSCQIWGGRTVFADGRLNATSCWRDMSPWSVFCFATGLSYLAPNNPFFNVESYGGWLRDTERHVDIVAGSLFLIDREIWDELRGFDPKFFMYGEEADLCIRARAAGATPIMTPSATIVHYGCASATSSAERRVQMFRGKVTLMNQHWSFPGSNLGLILLESAALIRWVGYRLAARLTGRLSMSDNADAWGATWKRRREWRDGYSLIAPAGMVRNVNSN
jgi:GT2 family glycosyltransferase